MLLLNLYTIRGEISNVFKTFELFVTIHLTRLKPFRRETIRMRHVCYWVYHNKRKIQIKEIEGHYDLFEYLLLSIF